MTEKRDIMARPQVNKRTEILTSHELSSKAYLHRRDVIWQWYPSSMADNNNDGHGDFSGMTRILPDMIKGFPVTGIWLNPVYESPFRDGGYDVKTYEKFNPKFGTVEDFLAFKDEAHKHNVNVIMDIVPNHVSNENKLFEEAKKGRDNPFRDYFIWRDPSPDGGPPSDARSNAGGSAWEYDEKTNQYYLHMFMKEQPDLNCV